MDRKISWNRKSIERKCFALAHDQNALWTRESFTTIFPRLTLNYSRSDTKIGLKALLATSLKPALISLLAVCHGAVARFGRNCGFWRSHHGFLHQPGTFSWRTCWKRRQTLDRRIPQNQHLRCHLYWKLVLLWSGNFTPCLAGITVFF